MPNIIHSGQCNAENLVQINVAMSTGNRADDEHEDTQIGCNLLACTQLLLQQSLIAAYMPILNSPAKVRHPKSQQCGPTRRPIHQRASILSTDKWTHSLHIPTKYVTHAISDNFWISLKLLNQYRVPELL
jgi:hypothetical protein